MIDDSPTHHRASFATYEFVTWARQLMGEKLVLQNNGTGVEARPERGTPKTNHFAFLASVPGPKGFQTRTLGRLAGTADGLLKTLDIARSHGRELRGVPSGFQRLDLERLQRYDEGFEQAP